MKQTQPRFSFKPRVGAWLLKNKQLATKKNRPRPLEKHLVPDIFEPKLDFVAGPEPKGPFMLIDGRPEDRSGRPLGGAAGPQ